nr:VWA domain-containing protein [Comamonas testosteroni]
MSRKRTEALQLEHLQYRQRPAGTSVMQVVMLDMSASMLKANKLARAKGYLLAIAEKAYRDREHIGVIGFGGKGAHWLQHPSKAQAFNDGWVDPVGGGGGTPLMAALDLLGPLLARCNQKVRVWVLTDGRFEHLPEKPQYMDDCLIVDFESDALALQRGKVLARQWGAQWASPFGLMKGE